MVRLWRHYARWNKSDREKQIVYDLTCGILTTKQTHGKRD